MSKLLFFVISLGTTVPSGGGSSKTTKMMTILMGTYYGFFLPTIVNSFLQYDVTVKDYVSPFLVVIFFLNAIVNPVIYAWMNKDFNEAFKKILRFGTRTAGSDIAVISNRKNLGGNNSSPAE